MPDTETLDAPETVAAAPNPLADVPDTELRRRRDAGLETVREVKRRNRAGTVTDRELHEGVEAVREVKASHAELLRRVEDRNARGLVDRLTRRAAPFSRVRSLEAPLLDGVSFDLRQLTEGEVREVGALVKVRHAGATPEEDARYVELVERAAGEVGLLARRRDEIAREESMRAEAAKLARTFLPERRRPEPGSAELPAFLFTWLTNEVEGTFDLADLGMLAALVYSFGNESGALFARGTFVHDEHGPSIVIGKGGTAHPRLVRGADDSGHLQVLRHLSTLKRNRWIETENVRGVWTIRPGERMAKLWR